MTIREWLLQEEKRLGCRFGQEVTKAQCLARAQWEREQAETVSSFNLRVCHERTASAYAQLARSKD